MGMYISVAWYNVNINVHTMTYLGISSLLVVPSDQLALSTTSEIK